MEEQHNAVTLTDANFQDEVLGFQGIYLVDFWADWCNPCRMMAPRVEELATKHAGKEGIKIGKLNVDENQNIAMNERVMSLPTFKLFRNGEVIDELVGAVPVQELENMLARVTPS